MSCEQATCGGWTLAAFGGSVCPRGVEWACELPFYQCYIGGMSAEAICPRQGTQFLRVVILQLRRPDDQPNHLSHFYYE